MNGLDSCVIPVHSVQLCTVLSTVYNVVCCTARERAYLVMDAQLPTHRQELLNHLTLSESASSLKIPLLKHLYCDE